MPTLNFKAAEAAFIAGFGVFHFAVPFLLPPNFGGDTFLIGLRIADFVLPGCFLVAILSLVYYFTANRYFAVAVAFLYCGGITFHLLYLAGLFPSVIVFPTKLLPAAGIIIDALSVAAIYDYYRRKHRTA